MPDGQEELASIEAEQTLLRRLIAIRQEIETLATTEPITGGWSAQGRVMAVRSAVSHIVAQAYALAETYNRALSDGVKLRKVK